MNHFTKLRVELQWHSGTRGFYDFIEIPSHFRTIKLVSKYNYNDFEHCYFKLPYTQFYFRSHEVLITNSPESYLKCKPRKTIFCGNTQDYYVICWGDINIKKLSYEEKISLFWNTTFYRFRDIDINLFEFAEFDMNVLDF